MRPDVRLARLALGTAGVLALLSAAAWAAGRAADAPIGDAYPALTDDTSGPLFTLTAMRAGDVAARCLTLTNEGPGTARVRMFGADRIDEDLAASLRLSVVRGSRPIDARAASCEGFVPDPTTYGYADAGVIYRGALADYAPTESGAIHDPGTWQAGDRHAYKLVVAVLAPDDDAARARRLTQSFAFAAEPAASTAASACRAVALPATRRAHGRLIAEVAVARRVMARLVVRGYGRAGREHLVMTTGLRVRGRALVIPRWAAIAYELNGRPLAVTGERPFRARARAAALRTGPNVVRVTIRRAGRDVREARVVFPLHVEPAGQGGRTVC